LRTLPLPYSFITIVWCSFVSHSTASLLSSFTEISLPFILLIFLMKGEGGITVRMENSPKVLLEQPVLRKWGRWKHNEQLCKAKQQIQQRNIDEHINPHLRKAVTLAVM